MLPCWDQILSAGLFPGMSSKQSRISASRSSKLALRFGGACYGEITEVLPNCSCLFLRAASAASFSSSSLGASEVQVLGHIVLGCSSPLMYCATLSPIPARGVANAAPGILITFLMFGLRLNGVLFIWFPGLGVSALGGCLFNLGILGNNLSTAEQKRRGIRSTKYRGFHQLSTPCLLLIHGPSYTEVADSDRLQPTGYDIATAGRIGTCSCDSLKTLIIVNTQKWEHVRGRKNPRGPLLSPFPS